MMNARSRPATLLRTASSPIVLLLVAGLACSPSLAGAQTAEEVVAASIAAAGGEEAMARIRNFTRTGHVSVESPLFGSLEGTLEAVAVPGRGYFESVELGPIAQQKGWDGTRGWEQGPTGLRMLEGDEGAMLVMQSFPNAFAAQRQLAPAGLRVERLDDADVNGRPHSVLAISSDGAPRTTTYVDRETSLVTRSVVTVSVPNLGELPVVIDVGGYEAVEGVKMPTTVTVTVEGISTTRVTIERTVVNTTVDESIFAVPGGAGAPTLPAAAIDAGAGVGALSE